MAAKRGSVKGLVVRSRGVVRGSSTRRYGALTISHLPLTFNKGWRILQIDENDKHSDLNAQKWNARAETYDQRRFDFMRFMQKRTIDLVTIRHGMSLLDIGCGTGWAVRHAAKRSNENGSFCGIDISPRMIEKATAQTPENRNIQFQVANLNSSCFCNYG